MMEHYPELKKNQTVELENFEFKLENIEQGFMRWFIVKPLAPKANKTSKEED